MVIQDWFNGLILRKQKLAGAKNVPQVPMLLFLLFGKKKQNTITAIFS